MSAAHPVRGEPARGGVWQLLKDTIKNFVADEALSHGASIAYYTLFAVAPVPTTVVTEVIAEGVAPGVVDAPPPARIP